VPPFFDPQSPTFTEAARQGFLVQDKTNGQPLLTKWGLGVGGLIDVTNRAALGWWRAGLQRLQTEYGIDGFKFDGGEANFVPENFQTFQPIEPRQYPDYYVAWVAENFAWTEVRTGWKAQRHGLFFRQWDKWSRWGLDNGLHAVLTQALTMSLTGYPFILPDMIGGNAYRGENPDAELLVRWTQLNALLPAMQFSVPPWSFNEATDAICHRYTLLHQELWPYFERQLQETLKTGIPLILPLFWRNPRDTATYAINDQFLLGETFLVAPVVQPGLNSRDIYLPQGSWRDYWSGEIYQGGQWLKDYPAGLDVLPLFESVTTQ
jgi:alpha-glucosidase (family GH31 glycosyl hydrolase)